MSNNTKTEQEKIPKHLDPFCHSTPSSIMKFLAAWDGLSLETILLLLEARKRKGCQNNELYERACHSDNPYLRYIGYQGIYNSELFYFCLMQDMEEKNKAANDPHSLVKTAAYECAKEWNREIKNPEQFFNLPQDVRLAMIRGYVEWIDGNEFTDDGFGVDPIYDFEKNISEIIIYGFKEVLLEKTVTGPELGEIVKELLLTPTKHAFHSGSWITLSSLWKLAAKEPNDIGGFLLKHLPANGAEELNEDDIKSMVPWQIKTLFWRADVKLYDLRKRFLLLLSQECSEDSVEVAELAATNLVLTDDEFTKIWSMSDDKKEKILRVLASRGEALCLHHHAAACGVIGSFWGYEAFEKKLARLQTKALKKRRVEYFQYRVYLQARNLCKRYPDRTEIEELPLELRKHLSQHIVHRDAWATYLAFQNLDIWWKNLKLVNLLPEGEIDWTTMKIKDETEPSDKTFVMPTYSEFKGFLHDLEDATGTKQEIIP